jgi:hypothetical protein
MVAIGIAPTGAAVTGKAGTGMGETGAANGMVRIGGIRTVNGLGGMATNGVITRLMSSLSAILGSHGGGVGAGARGQAGAGATPTTAIMVMGILTATDTVTTGTGTAMDMATEMAANTALLLNRE